MLYFNSIAEAEEVFKALSTPMRIRIMELISENDNMSMNDLAETLGLTNSAISMHVSKLEAAGLIAIQTASGKRGIMKVVRPIHERLIGRRYRSQKLLYRQHCSRSLHER